MANFAFTLTHTSTIVDATNHECGSQFLSLGHTVLVATINLMTSTSFCTASYTKSHLMWHSFWCAMLIRVVFVVCRVVLSAM
jgi:hypothetical protein